LAVGYTVAQLAELVKGKLHGDGSAVIHAALPIEDATGEAITFLADRRYARLLADCRAGAVLLPPSISPTAIPAIVVENPLAAMVRIAQALEPPIEEEDAGVDPRAAVDPTAVLGAGCRVGPFAVIERGAVLGKRCIIHPHAVIRAGCRLGDDVVLHPHAVLYPKTRIGDRTIIHSGAVIGCDGFGYQAINGVHQKVPQLGTVQIGADVEVGACSTIDRATFGATHIGAGTKIDNQVMIAHNCRIGAHNIFVSQSGIAGSSRTGDYVVLAGKAGVADHVTIGAGAVLGAMAGVFQDVPAGGVYLGLPARPEREAKRHHLNVEKVPEMRRQLAEVRAHLGLDADERPDQRRSA
jgi:UDP-3-O-[3-hydroxymyristoyl] glucosamine N-acyltransferase